MKLSGVLEGVDTKTTVVIYSKYHSGHQTILTTSLPPLVITNLVWGHCQHINKGMDPVFFFNQFDNDKFHSIAHKKYNQPCNGNTQ